MVEAISKRGTKRSVYCGRSVKVNGGVGREVRNRALDVLAFVLRSGVGIVKTAEPERAYIGGKSPLTYPHRVLDGLNLEREIIIAITVTLKIRASPPSLIKMGVKNDVFHIVIIEKIIPQFCAEIEAVVECKDHIWVDFTDDVTSLAVVTLQDIIIRVPPRLVHGLEGVQGGVLAIQVHELGYYIKGPLNTVFRIGID